MTHVLQAASLAEGTEGALPPKMAALSVNDTLISCMQNLKKARAKARSSETRLGLRQTDRQTNRQRVTLTHIHTHTHTHTHTQMRCRQSWRRPSANPVNSARLYTCVGTSHSRHSHTHSHTHARKHTHTHSLTHTRPHPECALARARAHTHTHTPGARTAPEATRRAALAPPPRFPARIR